jgi:hypothetical protein
LAGKEESRHLFMPLPKISNWLRAIELSRWNSHILKILSSDYKMIIGDREMLVKIIILVRFFIYPEEYTQEGEKKNLAENFHKIDIENFNIKLAGFCNVSEAQYQG